MMSSLLAGATKWIVIAFPEKVNSGGKVSLALNLVFGRVLDLRKADQVMKTNIRVCGDNVV